MKFLLDMGISGRAGNWLQDQGYDIVHLSDVGLFDLPDADIITKAIKEDKIILTADMDFGHILAFSKSDTVSVIQFRLSDFTPAALIEKLQLVLEKFSTQMQAGHHIITVEDNKVRVRKLPI